MRFNRSNNSLLLKIKIKRERKDKEKNKKGWTNKSKGDTSTNEVIYYPLLHSFCIIYIILYIILSMMIYDIGWAYNQVSAFASILRQTLPTFSCCSANNATNFLPTSPNTLTAYPT